MLLEETDNQLSVCFRFYRLPSGLSIYFLHLVNTREYLRKEAPLDSEDSVVLE